MNQASQRTKGRLQKKNGKFNDIEINWGTPHPPHPINDIFNDDKFADAWTPSLLASIMTNVTLTKTYISIKCSRFEDLIHKSVHCRQDLGSIHSENGYFLWISGKNGEIWKQNWVLRHIFNYDFSFRPPPPSLSCHHYDAFWNYVLDLTPSHL